MFDEICWYLAEFYSHILAAFHWRVEIFLNVKGNEIGDRGGDNDVEKELEGENIDRVSSTISRVIYYVSADSKLCSVGIILLRYIIYNNPAVRHVLPICGGDVLFLYEMFYRFLLPALAFPAPGNLIHFHTVSLRA